MNERFSEQLTTSNYTDLIQRFQNAGYVFENFSTYNDSNLGPFVLLRHDIDFSLEHALSMAQLENNLGVKSTFFVLISSPLYNTFSKYGIDTIRRIHLLGHDIALQYDPVIYDYFIDGLLEEIKLLKNKFGFANDKVVAFHRIGKKALEITHLKLPNEIMHTYEVSFFEKMPYFSDSGGAWKAGNPLNSDAFNQRFSMQILTHPLWWIEKGDTPLSKLNSFLIGNREATIELLQKWVISYSLESLRKTL